MDTMGSGYPLALHSTLKGSPSWAVMYPLGFMVISGAARTLITALALTEPASLRAVHVYSPSSFTSIRWNLKHKDD